MPDLRRPVRVGNCAGAACDAGYQMLRQCEGGPIDVVTGDFLAEANLAANVDAFTEGIHPGYEPNALDGLKLSLRVAKEKGIRLIVNGGALNPQGLARAIADYAKDEGISVTIGWTTGDDLLGHVHDILAQGEVLKHLDSENQSITYIRETADFIKNPENFEIVSAHAYLGARAIRRGLEQGCDVIICGRVSDASPVVAAAAWWHGWSDSDYDKLAGSLVAGHLIECSGYGSGGNFCEFFQFPRSQLLDIGYPIAEIHADGSSTITKHPGTRGFVTPDILKAQLLYEIQGNIYLHSDCKADLTNVQMDAVSQDRVRVTGTKGFPPPPTTKLAVFYRGGWQSEYTLNATGYAVAEKFKLHEAQIRFRLEAEAVLDDFQVLEFQVYGSPTRNPQSQLDSTSAIRVFGQAKSKETVRALGRAMLHSMMQHYAGMHGTLDWRLLEPKPYVTYAPCLIAQEKLKEEVCILHPDGSTITESIEALALFEELGPRLDHETADPKALDTFGPVTHARLGDLVLARSGDKGANLNIGLFVREADEWEWLKSFLSHEKMKDLMASEWREEFHLERCELPGVRAVHFVIYGILAKGVSSTARLDALGKGFAEFVRDRWVDLPAAFVERYAHTRPPSHRNDGSEW